MNLPTSYTDKFTPKANAPNVEYEFQSVGIELQPIYGKVIWTLFSKPKVTPEKVRRAHEIAVKRKKTNYAYLYGIIKKLC